MVDSSVTRRRAGHACPHGRRPTRSHGGLSPDHLQGMLPGPPTSSLGGTLPMRGHVVRSSLGKIGIWAHSSRLSADLAREIESMGYGAIWIGGSPGGDLRIVDQLLAATESLVVATGIV